MMRKFGSDPSGSRVNNLERGEAENHIKSAVFNDDAPLEVKETLADTNLYAKEKDWTPLYEDTPKNPPQWKNKSDQSE